MKKKGTHHHPPAGKKNRKKPSKRGSAKRGHAAPKHSEGRFQTAAQVAASIIGEDTPDLSEAIEATAHQPPAEELPPRIVLWDLPRPKREELTEGEDTPCHIPTTLTASSTAAQSTTSAPQTPDAHSIEHPQTDTPAETPHKPPRPAQPGQPPNLMQTATNQNPDPDRGSLNHQKRPYLSEARPRKMRRAPRRYLK